MLGWKLCRDKTAKEAMLDLQEKGVPRSIELLSPFLPSQPRIRHVQSPHPNEPMHYMDFSRADIYCEMYTVERPSDASLYEIIETEMVILGWYSQSLFPDRMPCHDRPWHLMEMVVMGVDQYRLLINPNQGSHMCTFRFLFFGMMADAMERVKQSEQAFRESQDSKINEFWWPTDITGRLSKLKRVGDQVRQGSFVFRRFGCGSPMICWSPDRPILPTTPRPKPKKSWKLRLLIYIVEKILPRQKSKKLLVR